MGAAASYEGMDYYHMAALLSNPDLIVPEALESELNAKVEASDYLGRSMRSLRNFQAKEQTQFTEEDAIDFEDVGLLLEPGHSPLEHGYVRRKDGTLYIAVLTDLGNSVSGELIDWWFTQCDDDEKYRWWHPLAHCANTFDPSFYAAMPWERPPGHYIDHVQVVEEVIDGQRRVLHYEYIRPNRYLDVTGFEEQGVTACILARLHLEHPKWGLMAIGHVAHIVRLVDGRNEMRSRYWLGDVFFAETPENFYFAQLLDRLANSNLARSLRLSTALADSLWVQVTQKMLCLKEWLPAVYRKARAEQERFQQQFSFN